VTRPDDTTSRPDGDDRGDDNSPDASWIDAALAAFDGEGQGVAAPRPPGENPYDAVAAAVTAALIAPVAVRPDLAARIAASGIEQVRARSRAGGPYPRLAGGGAAVTPAAAVAKSNWVTWSGWAVAAAACVALAFVALRSPSSGRDPDVIVAQPLPNPRADRERFIAAATASDPNFVTAAWSPGNTPEKVAGDVVWSDVEQRGYLRFVNLPINDPEKWVYQLWIFDATGDERYPVDGGVFSVTGVDPATGEAIVQIDPKIKVGKGVMFAVTIEKPGGVVVSDRSKIVALAKAS
jgi:hypothetical protein